MSIKDKIILYNTIRKGKNIINKYKNLKKLLGRKVQGVSGQDALENLAYIDIMKLCAEIESSCYENVAYNIREAINQAQNNIVARPTQQDVLEIVENLSNALHHSMYLRKLKTDQRVKIITVAVEPTKPSTVLPDSVPDFVSDLVAAVKPK